MAAIDYFGNVIRITAAGTLGYDNLDIECAYIWTVNSSGSLIASDVAAGSNATVFRYSTNINQASYEPLHLSGRFNKISFDTVTACTAWIVKR